MVSEEVGFNHAMEAAGIEAFESDMGEYIVQLAGETPSHIIMPAIHKTKQEIAALFAAKIPGADYTEDVDALIKIGRQVLRRKFAEADIGLSGVNFAVAETGTLCLVENEGNGRMCTTVPRVHIAVTGIEKVVEKLEHVPPLYSLLTRSATGQAVTTYFNLISRPRQPGEKDGPEEVHLILLDNGRTQAYADEQLRATLQCIRCGACMNHCPVYARIGGHAYGTTYPGPIGAIISPHMLGSMPPTRWPSPRRCAVPVSKSARSRFRSPISWSACATRPRRGLAPQRHRCAAAAPAAPYAPARSGMPGRWSIAASGSIA